MHEHSMQSKPDLQYTLCIHVPTPYTIVYVDTCMYLVLTKENFQLNTVECGVLDEIIDILNPFTAVNGYIRFGVVTSQNDC